MISVFLKLSRTLNSFCSPHRTRIFCCLAKSVKTLVFLIHSCISLRREQLETCLSTPIFFYYNVVIYVLFMTGIFVHTGVCFSFFVCFLSPLVWFFLWLPEEVLALLFLLHCENGDFSILMKGLLQCGYICFTLTEDWYILSQYLSKKSEVSAGVTFFT